MDFSTYGFAPKKPPYLDVKMISSKAVMKQEAFYNRGCYP
jgi:hypothetical protein